MILQAITYFGEVGLFKKPSSKELELQSYKWQVRQQFLSIVESFIDGQAETYTGDHGELRNLLLLYYWK